MKRPVTKTEYVIGAFFALAALLPLATTDDGYVIDVLPPLASVVGDLDGMEEYDNNLSQRRLIKKVMEICERRNVDCPDVNDYAGLRRFIRGIPAVHEAAPEADADESITILDLTETQRGLLRRYLNVRTCPEGLNDILPGFFDLCTSILEDTEDTRPRLKSDRSIPIGLFPQLQPTLDALIKMRNPN